MSTRPLSTRQNFLNRLRAGLRGLPAATVNDIVADYDTHFAEAASRGRTEDEAASRLGDPARLARELRAEAGMKRWEEERNLGAALGAVVAVLGLATIDLFIMLPLLLVAGVLVLAFLIVGVCVCLVGSIGLVAALLHLTPGFGGTWLQGVLLAIGVTAGGASVVAFCSLFIIGAVNLLVRYGRLHIRAADPARAAIQGVATMIRALATVAIGGALIAIVCIGASGAGRSGSWHIPGASWSFDTDDDHAGPSLHLTGRETIVTRDLPWQGGERLTFDVPAAVTFTQGPVAKITLTGPDALVGHVVLDGERLKLDRSVHGISVRNSLKIAITGPSLHEFNLDSALKLDIHALATDALTLAIDGAGSVTAQGSAHSVKVTIDGAGEADLNALTLTDARIEIDGIGHVAAGPTGDAHVQIDGAGKVSLTKRPQHLSQEINGVGSVSQPDAPAGQTL